MTESFVNVLMFGFAVVGLVGFSSSPYRGFEAARFALRSPSKIVALVPLCVAGLLLYAWATTYHRIIFKCLSVMICGPNKAQGVISLAMFGVLVVAYELLRFLAIRFYRRNAA